MLSITMDESPSQELIKLAQRVYGLLYNKDNRCFFATDLHPESMSEKEWLDFVDQINYSTSKPEGIVKSAVYTTTVTGRKESSEERVLVDTLDSYTVTVSPVEGNATLSNLTISSDGCMTFFRDTVLHELSDNTVNT